MFSDMEEGECFSDYSECRRCGRGFPNCKAWGAHIKSCYKKYNSGFNNNTSVTVTTNSSSCSSDLDHQETDIDVSLNLVGYLSGGWSKKRKRGTCGTSPSTSSASASSVDHESRIALQLGSSVEKEQESSNLNKKFKVGAMKEEEGLGHPGKYTCKQCGQEFSDFRGLGGHVSFHNRKRRMEVEGDHEESKPNKNGKKRHQCDQCDKSFPTGQALGGHKRIHWNGHPIKRFDLNQLPPEAKFLENETVI